MENEKSNPYHQFSTDILESWKNNGVKYVKAVELETDMPIKFFELIPDSEIMDSDETIYPIDSDDVTELLEILPAVKFLVHEIYLDEEF